MNEIEILIAETLPKLTDKLKQKYWKEHAALATTSFASASDAMKAATNLGKIAEGVLKLQEAQAMLLNTNLE